MGAIFLGHPVLDTNPLTESLKFSCLPIFFLFICAIFQYFKQHVLKGVLNIFKETKIPSPLLTYIQTFQDIVSFEQEIQCIFDKIKVLQSFVCMLQAPLVA